MHLDYIRQEIESVPYRIESLLEPAPRADTIAIVEKDWPINLGWNTREPTQSLNSAWTSIVVTRKLLPGEEGRLSVHMARFHMGFKTGLFSRLSKSTIVFLHPGRSEKKVHVAGKKVLT